ncbi:MAG: hypothetical protein A3K90_06640 [Pelodictyon luteolum]|uniref:Uncharacterized protein n=1 Tax=Pelodictyon luteolum TaxID=1100 RepID=A0A165LUX2_PELLU|nr:MAG: hypothetical protein A3K90_06640 [Pelodictyon luteolum]
MGSNVYFSQDLCASTYIDMAFNDWSPFSRSADSDLMHDQAVGTDYCRRMDYDAVWVRDQETSSDVGIDWDVRSTNRAPESMLEYGDF